MIDNILQNYGFYVFLPAGLTACEKHTESRISTEPFSPNGLVRERNDPHIRNGHRHRKVVRSAIKTILNIRDERGYWQAVRSAWLGSANGHEV